ncbi:uncharacterized protein TNCV_4383701 [Trichonephila clavipes]|nr:uncharacterized protein TNCV_4383701 [Trichonephila clavipes]
MTYLPWSDTLSTGLPHPSSPLLTQHQREDVSALDRFNVHRCPTWRVFSGTGLELGDIPAKIRYLNHWATAASRHLKSWLSSNSSAANLHPYLLLKEGRFVQGTFRSERMRIRHRSCQNYRLRVLVLVHIDTTPPHTPLPVFRRIGERTIPYSWRACKQLCHSCVTACELRHLCETACELRHLCETACELRHFCHLCETA